MSESIFLHPQNDKLFLSINLQKGMTCFCRVLGGRSGPCHRFDYPSQARLARWSSAHEIPRGRHLVIMCCGEYASEGMLTPWGQTSCDIQFLSKWMAVPPRRKCSGVKLTQDLEEIRGLGRYQGALEDVKGAYWPVITILNLDILSLE